MSGLRALNRRDWQRLLRLRLGLMVTASAAVGFLLSPERAPLSSGLMVLAAVACLCSGCTVLNQIQERDLDARMLRTAERPIAAGRLSVAAALRLSRGLLLIGLVSLLLLEPASVWLGVFAIFWYNGVYTPLKRHTALAVFPGALCGPVPALIGWQVAGGALTHPAIVLVCGLLVLWQIPHFLLLVARYRSDYRRAGLPIFGAIIEAGALRRILYLWLTAISVAFLLFPAVGVVRGTPFQGLTLLLALALGTATWYLGRREDWGRLFMQLNLHMGLVLLLVVCDHLLSGFP